MTHNAYILTSWHSSGCKQDGRCLREGWICLYELESTALLSAQLKKHLGTNDTCCIMHKRSGAQVKEKRIEAAKKVAELLDQDGDGNIFSKFP